MIMKYLHLAGTVGRGPKFVVDISMLLLDEAAAQDDLEAVAVVGDDRGVAHIELCARSAPRHEAMEMEQVVTAMLRHAVTWHIMIRADSWRRGRTRRLRTGLHHFDLPGHPGVVAADVGKFTALAEPDGARDFACSKGPHVEIEARIGIRLHCMRDGIQIAPDNEAVGLDRRRCEG